MSEPLSFTVKVRSCRDCPHAKIHDIESWCGYPFDYQGCEFATFEENYEAITPSCPAWQEQQKEKSERIAFVKRVAEQTFINSHNSDLVGIVAKAEYLYDILKTWESKQ